MHREILIYPVGTPIIRQNMALDEKEMEDLYVSTEMGALGPPYTQCVSFGFAKSQVHPAGSTRPA
jgi:hypothetical protein